MDVVHAAIASEMKAVEDRTINNASLSSYNLTLNQKNGTAINTGNARGPTGATAANPYTWYGATSVDNFFLGSSSWIPVDSWTIISGSNTALFVADTDPSFLWRYNTKVAGLYYVRFRGSISSGPAGRRIVAIFKNDVEEVRTDYLTASYYAGTVSTLIQLEVNDTIHFSLYQSTGELLDKGGAPHHEFLILKIQ